MFWEIPALSSPLDAYKVSEDIGEWIIFIEYLSARAEYVATDIENFSFFQLFSPQISHLAPFCLRGAQEVLPCPKEKNKGEKKGDQWARFLFIALHCSDENKILHKTKNTFTEIHLTTSTEILELKDVTQNWNAWVEKWL